MRILLGECIAEVGDGDRESLFWEARAVANVVECILTDRQEGAFPGEETHTSGTRGVVD